MARTRVREASGRLLLRLPPAVHAVIRVSAQRLGVSVNEFCVRRLATGGPTLGLREPWPELVTRANGQFGPALAGVLAHGSQVRGTAHVGSDIDALIVVDPTIPLTRSLYDEWEASPLDWQGPPLDVHFVHLSNAGDPPSGLWCEAATEGVVVWERDEALTAWLLYVRQEIAEGRLVRRFAQGQPYWVAA